MVQVEDGNENITQYTYTSTGKLSSVRDPKGQETNFTHDIRDRVIGKQFPNGQAWEYSYDGVGNMIYTKDPRGNVTQLDYDAVNRVNQKLLVDDVYSYEYDTRNNLTRAENNKSLILFEMDFKGNLLTETVVGKGDLSDYPLHSKRYTYNSQELKASFSDSFLAGTTRCLYRNNGQLSQVDDLALGVFNYNYDDLDRLKEIQGPQITSNFEYGLKSFLTSISHKKGVDTKSYFDFDRSESGLIRKIASTIGEENFSYNERNYLTNASHPSATHSNELDFSTESFSYDELGNRSSSSFGNLIYDEFGYALDENYKYRYTYDLNGNLITKEDKVSGNVVKYDYTSENRLEKVSFLDSMISSVPTKEVDQFYDAIGRRIKKAVSISSGSKVTKYTYDGQQVVNKLGASNQFLARYAHSGLRTDDVLGVLYSSAAVSAGLTKSAGSYSYLKDHLGSIKQIADSNGKVIQTNNYSAFGVITSVQNALDEDVIDSPEVEVYHSFTGREWDKDSGLYYYRARHYDAEIGRFIQQDPHPGKLQLPLSLNNKYAYAFNNPNSYVDPDGNFGFLASIFLSGLFSAGVSAIQAGIQTDWGKTGNFGDAFNTNFLINFSATILGLTSSGIQAGFDNKDYNLGWAGVYNDSKNIRRGFSLGFFQATSGDDVYWHEAGHSINFALLGAFSDPKYSVEQRLIGASSFYGVHLLGSLGGRYNPFTYLTEGTADVWSWDFDQLLRYTGRR